MELYRCLDFRQKRYMIVVESRWLPPLLIEYPWPTERL